MSSVLSCRAPAPASPLVAAAGLAPAQPASAHHGCSAHVGDGKIAEKTREAVVVEKENGWYGCAARVGRPYRLPGLDTPRAIDFGDGTVPNHVTLSGVFVAYERYTLHPAGGPGDTQTDLHVADLRSGEVVVEEDAAAPSGARQEDRQITDIVLKRNGKVGWIGRLRNWDEDPAAVDYVVHRFSRDLSSHRRAAVDSGEAINRNSLTLSPDRRRMRWKKAGERHSVPLP